MVACLKKPYNWPMCIGFRGPMHILHGPTSIRLHFINSNN